MLFVREMLAAHVREDRATRAGVGLIASVIAVL